MAKMKLVRKQNYFQRRQNFQANPRPIGNKNIFNRRIRLRDIKIEKTLPQYKNIQVKHGVRVVREMVVKSKTYYPSNKRRLKC